MESCTSFWSVWEGHGELKPQTHLRACEKRRSLISTWNPGCFSGCLLISGRSMSKPWVLAEEGVFESLLGQRGYTSGVVQSFAMTKYVREAQSLSQMNSPIIQ